VDISEEFRSIELCAGYAGIHLGLERVIRNLRTVAYVEIESFACANLVAKMEADRLDVAPIWTNLKTFNAEPFRDRIHIITGGYPCQPFSTAGKRKGKDDPRHLWPNIREIVKTIRPILCFFENVEGHLSLGFKEVQQSLRALGYTVEAGIFSAAECGAPQQRKRLFILAYSSESGSQGRGRLEEQKKGWCFKKSFRHDSSGHDKSWPSRPGEPQHEWEPPRVVANSVSMRKPQPERCERNERGWPVNGCEELGNTTMQTVKARERSSGKRGIQERNKQSDRTISQQRQTKSSVGRNLNGSADRMDNAELYESCDNRTDELRLLGNGVIPDVAEKAFITLYEKIMVGINATT
jgi:DNA-cytosine methyltransferase